MFNSQRRSTINAGKGLSNENQQAAIAGQLQELNMFINWQKLWRVVILHTDHAAKKLLPWIDGLLDASEKHFEETGKPLFSSHMIDLSEEPLEEKSKSVKNTSSECLQWR
ncbi:MAG: hypothetical protein CM15mP59_2690 [Flavobacteriaceae bacterium]|nr:MAG: hypothetical protein CM15mP59_2690 [Flavobacteriaceae bacterium]